MNAWQFYAIRDSGGLWFVGTIYDAPGWGAHVEDAYAMPSLSCAKRRRDMIQSYQRDHLHRKPDVLEIVPVDADNSTGPTRVVGVTEEAKR